MTETGLRLPRWLLLISLAVALGCNEDKRLIALSRESLDRQAEQNKQMARQTEAVAEATKQLVEAEAESRRQSQGLLEQLHTERQSVDRQQEELASARRQVAIERQREPIIAESIKGVVSILVAALPLVICGYLARALILSADDDVTAADLLIDQLLTEGPLLTACLPTELPAPPVSLPPPVLSHRVQSSDGDSESPAQQISRLQVVVVLEGTHDVEFLKRISRIVAAAESFVPDLVAWESAGRITFVVSNGNARPFPTSRCDQPPLEFHLLDREVPPVTAQRERTIQALNARRNTRAFLTRKRAIENYLHPDAIREASGLDVAFGDFDDVPELVAHVAIRQGYSPSWKSLSPRARRRRRDKAKHWLNREAVERMTPERLAERDPEGEVIGWLRTIAELAATLSDPGI